MMNIIKKNMKNIENFTIVGLDVRGFMLMYKDLFQPHHSQ